MAHPSRFPTWARALLHAFVVGTPAAYASCSKAVVTMGTRGWTAMMVLSITAWSCEPSTAMAQPAHTAAVSPSLYKKGHAPRRPMELLQDVALEVSPALGAQGALALLRAQALAQGADAVVDVVVEQVKTVSPLGELSAMPNLVMGALVSLCTWNPDALAAVSRQGLAVTRTVLVVRGVPVRFLR